ncbi:MAG: Flp family type IVb pilin [Actinomycetota bacterium]|nr:Flp family type IVb pilin [Actinomycetota bacterium]
MITNTPFSSFLNSQTNREDGQALVEYMLILGLVAIVCVASVEAIGVGVNNALNAVIGSL